ncbi:HNH endonuclease [Gordonibacter urolithinfaciens]|uniref:HNH endonuclease n=1 Tax=Gordonibacter urolithinfaciens TaxID=1335613 RepID=UPI001179A3E8|nr:HNH endonuclease [Gordonibacter urolithinfaciens]
MGCRSNPSWDRAELILALDLYFNHTSLTKHGSQAEFRELSETLRMMDIYDNIPDWSTFRNANSVGSKIANFEFLDNDEKSTGLSGASKLDKAIWNEFHDNPELVHAMAQGIRNAIECATYKNGGLLTNQINEGEFSEGKFLCRVHAFRERDSKVVRVAKERAQKRGELHCCVCGFDFEAVYGVLGEGYIECHHTKPISEYEKGEKTRVEDLALVCSNCHRMLHRHVPLLLPEELQKLIEQEKEPSKM